MSAAEHRGTLADGAVRASGVLLLLLCLVRLQGPSQIVVLGEVIFLVSLRLLRVDRATYLAALSLGLLTPLSPALGTPTLLAIGIAFLCLGPTAPRLRGFSWALPLLFVLGCWVIAETWYDIDIELVGIAGQKLVSLGDPGRAIFFEWLRAAAPHFVSSWESFARVLLLLGLFDLGRREGAVAAALVRGQLIAWPVALGAAVVQVAGRSFPLLANQTAYWTRVGRFTGTFTDPNAFGIYALLLLPVLWQRFRAGRAGLYWAAMALASLVLGAYSGSRTFFVALFLYAVLGSVRLGRKAFLLLLLAAALAILVMNTSTLFDRVTEHDALPIGVLRVIKSIRADTLPQSLQSRVAFFHMDWLVFRDHPLFGAGYDHFRALVPAYSPLVGLRSGRFTDNPNSFYLGILAETGLVGFGALLASLARLRFAADAPPAPRAALIVLALVLSMGPHLDFDEVTVLTATLMAMALEVTTPRVTTRQSAAVAAAACAVGIFIRERDADRGIYSWQADSIVDQEHPFAPPQPVAWTSGVAQATLVRPKGDVLSISMRDTWPKGPPRRPLFVNVTVDGMLVDRVRVSWGRFEHFSWYLPCASKDPATRTVRLEASATFRLPDSGHDWRPLGFMVRPFGFEVLAPGAVAGLFPWEASSGHQYRWSCGRNVILQLPEPGSEVRLRMLTISHRVPRIPMNLRIRVIGGSTQLVQLRNHKWLQVRVPLPRGVPAMVTIEADHTFVPGWADTRELSFALGPWSLVK